MTDRLTAFTSLPVSKVRTNRGEAPVSPATKHLSSSATIRDLLGDSITANTEGAMLKQDLLCAHLLLFHHSYCLLSLTVGQSQRQSYFNATMTISDMLQPYQLRLQNSKITENSQCAT